MTHFMCCFCFLVNFEISETTIREIMNAIANDNEANYHKNNEQK